MGGDSPSLDEVQITVPDDVPEGTSFEVAVADLEQCVDLLEAGEVGLEEALRLFRRGAALQAWCEARLDGIRATIEELTADGTADGPFTTTE